MNKLRDLLHLNGGRDACQTGLDMGDGRTLTPEDILDGHVARLLANRRRQAIRTTVPVQVDDDLSAAITVMAPDLAPLADLAEEVAVAVPAVAPAPAFRQNLYDALERTHRQYRVQKALGTRPSQRGGAHRTTGLWMLVGFVAIALTAFGWLALRRRRSE